jgi:hypothetical protein
VAIEKVSANDPFVPSASMHNATVDLLNAAKRKALGGGREVFTGGDKEICSRVRLKNVSAANRRRGEVLKIGALATTSIDIAGMQAFEGSVPTATTDNVAVLLEKINYSSDDIGLAQLMGVTPAIVDMQTSGDKWAVIDPSSAVLKSATSSGMFPILHAPSGTGEKDCVILMDRATAPTGVAFRNDSGEEIPPYAVMEQSTVDSDGTVVVIKPTNRREGWLWLVNNSESPVAIAGTSSNGTWACDEPEYVLEENISSDYSSGFFQRGSTMAPKPGYWHVTAKGHDDIPGGLTTGGGAYKIEDYGFKSTTNKSKSVSYSATYDFGNGDGPQSTLWVRKLQQQVEPTEISQIIPLRQAVFDSTPTSQTWMTYNAYYSVRALQTDNSKHSRVGIDVTNGSSSVKHPFRIMRRGYYRVEVKIHLEYDGYQYAGAFDTTDTSTTSAHIHTYDKIKAACLAPITAELFLQTDPTKVDLVMQESVMAASALVRICSVSIPPVNLGSDNTRFTLYGVSYVTSSTNLDAYDSSSDNPHLGVFIKLTAFDISQQIRILAGTTDTQESSYVNFTRLRNCSMMME